MDCRCSLMENCSFPASSPGKCFIFNFGGFCEFVRLVAYKGKKYFEKLLISLIASAVIEPRQYGMLFVIGTAAMGL